jgi:hypothetical protein
MTPFTIGSGGDIQSWASFPVATDSALVFGFVGRASGGEPVVQDLKQIIEGPCIGKAFSSGSMWIQFESVCILKSPEISEWLVLE